MYRIIYLLLGLVFSWNTAFATHSVGSLGESSPDETELRIALRDLWTGHVFWVRSVVLSSHYEAFWSGSLRLHESIAGEEHGGVGPGLSPATALSLGLKIDTEALPQEVLDAIAAAQVDLQDPAVTAGEQLFNGKAQCASCHVPPLFTEPGYNMAAARLISDSTTLALLPANAWNICHVCRSIHHHHGAPASPPRRAA